MVHCVEVVQSNNVTDMLAPTIGMQQNLLVAKFSLRDDEERLLFGRELRKLEECAATGKLRNNRGSSLDFLFYPDGAVCVSCFGPFKSYSPRFKDINSTR